MSRFASALCVLALAAVSATADAQIVADFTASPTTVPAGDPVTFTDATTGGSPFALSWDFGDGAQAATNQPTIDHAYEEPGVYTVTLTVFGLPENDTVVKSDLITVTPAMLTPSFDVAPAAGPVLLDVQFTDTTTGVGAPTGWLWDFGDGASSTEQNPLHTYTAPGTYDVTLDVSVGGDTWSVTQLDAVVVGPATYTPDFDAAPTVGVVPLTVSFTNATIGAAPTAWFWNFGDGTTSDKQNPTHEFDTPGTYSVTFTAFVGQQAETVTKTDLVVVDPAPLTPAIGASTTSGPAALTVLFTDETSGVTPTGWLWDFGDGATSTLQDPLHVYEVPGVYTVALETTYFGQSASVVAADMIHVGHQASLNVPGDASTIQAAVDMAGPYTEILIAPGTYHEAIALGVAPVTLRGVEGAGTTIIDATGLDQPVVRLDVASSPGKILQGLTLTGGSSPTGGGIRIGSGASLLVRECIVRDNESLGEGGGVWVSSSNARIELIDSTLCDNTAVDDGGGLAIEGSLIFGDDEAALLERCAIVENTSGRFGGGLLAGTARDCVFSGNTAVSGGGAAWSDVERCTFLANTASDTGGGFIDSTTSGSLFATQLLTDCIFLDNTAGIRAGGARLFASAKLFASASATRCVFSGNSAPEGDALWMSADGDTSFVVDSTLVGDTVFADEELIVRSSIFRSGTDPFEGSFVDAVEYSNVEGGWPGVGNFDADPLFVDVGANAFGLRPGSPCIDAGNPVSPLDGDGSPADVGALPFTSIHPVGAPLHGELGLPELTVVSDLTPGAPLTLSIARGPASGSATLVLGVAALSAPLKGGVLVPQPLDFVPGIPLDADGDIALPGLWPAGLPTGTTVWLQAWSADTGGAKGFSSTNGLALVQP